MEQFRQARKGQLKRPSANEENRKTELLESVSGFYAQSGALGPEGLLIDDPDKSLIVGVIIGRNDDNPLIYNWKRLELTSKELDTCGVQDTDTGVTATPITADYGKEGFDPTASTDTGATYPAMEFSGNPEVPLDGTGITYFWQSEAGDCWIFSWPARGFWAQLSNQTADGTYGYKYDWTEKIRVLSGGVYQFINPPYASTGYRRSRTGTTTTNPAHEVNGAQVANGTYVILYPSAQAVADTTTDCEYLFVAPPSTGGANHNLLSATHPDTVPYSPPVKGDIIAGTDQGGGTYKWARRAVGTNGYVLTADSTHASGLNWSDVGNTYITNLYVTLLSLTWNTVDILTLIDVDNNFVIVGTGKSKFRLTYTGGLGSGLGFLGISGGVDGQICFLYNSTDNVLILKHESTLTAAANRFVCPNNHDYNLWPKSGAIVEWNSILNRWVFDCQDVGYLQVQVGGINPGWENVLDFHGANGITISAEDDPVVFKTRLTISGPPQQEGNGKDWWYYPPGQIGRFQCAGLAIDGIVQNTSIVGGRLQAMPLPLPRGGTISTLSIYIVFGAATGKKVFLGVYANVADTDCRPGALLASGSALIDASALVTGIVSVTLDRQLQPGLYWIAHFVEADVTGNAVDGLKCYPILGFASPANATLAIGWEDSAFAGAVMPNPFPNTASALLATGNGATPTITAVYVKYSG